MYRIFDLASKAKTLLTFYIVLSCCKLGSYLNLYNQAIGISLFPNIQVALAETKSFQIHSSIASLGDEYITLDFDGSVKAWSLVPQLNSFSQEKLDFSEVKHLLSNRKDTFIALLSSGGFVSWGKISKLSQTGSLKSIFYNANGALSGLNSDGTVLAWGDERYGGSVSSLSAEGSNWGFKSVIPNDVGFMGLRSDGSALFWGDSGGCNGCASKAFQNIKRVLPTSSSFYMLRSDGVVISSSEPHQEISSKFNTIIGAQQKFPPARTKYSGISEIQDIFKVGGYSYLAFHSNGVIETWNPASVSLESKLFNSGHFVSRKNDSPRSPEDKRQILRLDNIFVFLYSNGDVTLWDSTANTTLPNLFQNIAKIYSTYNSSFIALQTNGHINCWEIAFSNLCDTVVGVISPCSRFDRFMSFDVSKDNVYVGHRIDGNICIFGKHYSEANVSNIDKNSVFKTEQLRYLHARSYTTNKDSAINRFHLQVSPPSSQPSRQPTVQPISHPSAQPTFNPSSPSCLPSGQPSGQPFSRPSSQPTRQPFMSPTMQPSNQPSANPSNPSNQPTMQPSRQPIRSPSSQPSQQPTANPSRPSTQPTMKPSTQPSRQPTSHPSNPSSQPSRQPSGQPSSQPTGQPSRQPTMRPSTQPTNQPSSRPSQPSSQPSRQPTRQPSSQPSAQPIIKPTSQPSSQPWTKPSSPPTSLPSNPSSQPSHFPSNIPSSQPSQRPTQQPSSQPSRNPSIQPSAYPSNPSSQPSRQPSSFPTNQPSALPTRTPSCQPSRSPTKLPSSQPTAHPSRQPSRSPTEQPSWQPTRKPSVQPSRQPSSQPTKRPCVPTSQPSRLPSNQPSCQPSSQPLRKPSTQPTVQPSKQPCHPTSTPSRQPTSQPSQQPSCHPSKIPTRQPSSRPTAQPSSQPSDTPTTQPSILPSMQPSITPTNQPLVSPTARPSTQPFRRPSGQPSVQPASKPTKQPMSSPTSKPSKQPTSQPSNQPSKQPICRPSTQPTHLPSSQPTRNPTHTPHNTPSSSPTVFPSVQPSSKPSQPTSQPIGCPSCTPTRQPSNQPSRCPSKFPSTQPSLQPQSSPSSKPSRLPSQQPSREPTSWPSAKPSRTPSQFPSEQPSRQPSNQPSDQPSSQPFSRPSVLPSSQPSGRPSSMPSSQPTSQPSLQPYMSPTAQPSSNPSSSSEHWLVYVDRLDDFFDLNLNRDHNILDMCSNSLWESTSLSNNCTFRLALAFCLFRFPWSRDHPASNLSCTLKYPDNSRILMNGFNLYGIENWNEIRRNIIIDYSNSVLHIDSSLLLNTLGLRTNLHIVRGNFICHIKSKNLTKGDILFDKLSETTFRDCTFTSCALSMNEVASVGLQSVIISDSFEKTKNNDQSGDLRELQDFLGVKFNLESRPPTLTITSSKTVRVYNCTFRNNSKTYLGAGIAVSHTTNFVIIASWFEQNCAQYGSAIVLHRVQRSLIVDSFFINNSASVGGAIYWIARDSDADTDRMPAPIISNCSFINNSATIYGADVASSFYAFGTSFNESVLTSYISVMLDEVLNISTQDYYGSIIPYYAIAKASIVDEKSKCNFNFPKFISPASQRLVKGFASFGRIGALCIPGGEIVSQIFVTIHIPSGIYVGNIIEGTFYQPLRILFRNCRRGEVYDLDSVTHSTCSVCEGRYSLVPFETSPANSIDVPSTCQRCPPMTQRCFSDTMQLYEGTWRLDVKSTAIFPCNYVHACRGNKTAGANSCIYPYYGPLCGVCADRHILQKNLCIACDNSWTSVIFTVVGVITVIATYQYSKKYINRYISDELFGYLNTVVNSCQVLSLMAFRMFSLGDFFKSLLDLMNILNMEAWNSLHIPCIIKSNYFRKMLASVLSPLVIIAFLMAASFRNYVQEKKVEFIYMIWCVLFLYYALSNITNILFAIFDCIDLDPYHQVSPQPGIHNYIVSDLSLTCYGALYEEHKAIVYFMIIVYPIGVPLLLLFMLFWSRDLIQHSKLVSKLQSAMDKKVKIGFRYHFAASMGFLYSNYKPNFWYFEIIEVISRLTVTSFVLLIRDMGIRLVVLIFISLFQTKLQLSLQPYLEDRQNVLSAIGKVQILALNVLSYVSHVEGLSIENAHTLKPQSNRQWYGYFQNIVVSSSLLQMGWCIYFMYLEIVDIRKREEKLRRKTLRIDRARLSRVSKIMPNPIPIEEKKRLENIPYKILIAPTVLTQDLLKIQAILLMTSIRRATTMNSKILDSWAVRVDYEIGEKLNISLTKNNWFDKNADLELLSLENEVEEETEEDEDEEEEDEEDEENESSSSSSEGDLDIGTDIIDNNKHISKLLLLEEEGQENCIKDKIVCVCEDAAVDVEVRKLTTEIYYQIDLAAHMNDTDEEEEEGGGDGEGEGKVEQVVGILEKDKLHPLVFEGEETIVVIDDDYNSNSIGDNNRETELEKLISNLDKLYHAKDKRVNEEGEEEEEKERGQREGKDEFILHLLQFGN